LDKDCDDVNSLLELSDSEKLKKDFHAVMKFKKNLEKTSQNELPENMKNVKTLEQYVAGMCKRQSFFGKTFSTVCGYAPKVQDYPQYPYGFCA
jgi:hypothetical protein